MRVEVVRERIFLQRDELAAVPIDMSVRSSAIDVRDARVVRVWVPIDAPETLARLALGHQALRLHVARLEVDRPVREAERAHVAVAVEAREPLVLRRRIREVALHPEQRAFDVGRDLSPDLAVIDVGFEAGRAVEPAALKQRMT